MARMGWMVVVTVAVVGATQEWEEEPGYKEVNPGGEVVMSCLVRHKRGECRWERDNTPIAAFPGKYEWAGSREQGDCSLRILVANFDYDNGGWVCQVTASSFRERDTLISQPASLVVRGEFHEQNSLYGYFEISGVIVCINVLFAHSFQSIFFNDDDEG
jgi:hypothetical protein